MADTASALLKQVDFLILAVLTAEPLHGYGIVQELERISDGRIQLRPGDVYRVLYRMHRQGLIEPLEPEQRADERRTYYGITKRGRTVAEAEARLLSGVSARLLAGQGAADGA